MKFLALRMTGNLQSWSPSSRFTQRTAGKHPTLSGVTGIVLSALGYERDDVEGLRLLQGATLAVRVDDPGTIMRDYHTVEFKPGNKKLTDRFYLQDAKFYALLYFPEGNSEDLLVRLDEGLRKPQNVLFLGRKTCIPSTPLRAGIIEAEGVEEALASLPYLCERKGSKEPERVQLEAWVPGDAGREVTLVPDVPTNFDSRSREYTSRIISKVQVSVPNPFCKTTSLDPFKLLEG